MRIILCFMISLFFLNAAHADDELMVLWPKQRDAHQVVMDAHKDAYAARAEELVNHLYATGGEEGLPSYDDSISSIGENIDPKPVNIEEVAEIVKDSQ